MYQKFLSLLQAKTELLEHQGKALDMVAIVAETDIKGDIIYANKNFCDITGYSYDELIGKNYRLLNSSHLSLANYRDMYRMIRNKQPWRGEICNQRKDGETYWVDTTILPKIDHKGNIELYTAIRFDITERKRDQEQLGLYAYEIEQANTELLQLDHAREELLAAVSHELRTPLACVQECIALVMDGTIGTVNERQIEFCALAVRNLSMLNRLVNDLLDAAAIEAGGSLTLHKETINCYSLVKEAVDLLEMRAFHKQQKLALDFLDRSLWIQGDKRRLMQVMLNLISNAVKYSEEGKEIICGYDRMPDNKVRLFVKDFGIGLDENQKRRVFERFYRAPAGKGKYVEGIGLGLHLCKQIVEAHNGSIDCESTPGKGSTFYLILEEKTTFEVTINAREKIILEKSYGETNSGR